MSPRLHEATRERGARLGLHPLGGKRHVECWRDGSTRVRPGFTGSNGLHVLRTPNGDKTKLGGEHQVSGLNSASPAHANGILGDILLPSVHFITSAPRLVAEAMKVQMARSPET